uniref:Uncharacterized protein n=1 Tax=Arundo donax TaxID=35708 RepID=A0A0A9TUS4_ARUDO
MKTLHTALQGAKSKIKHFGLSNINIIEYVQGSFVLSANTRNKLMLYYQSMVHGSGITIPNQLSKAILVTCSSQKTLNRSALPPGTCIAPMSRARSGARTGGGRQMRKGMAPVSAQCRPWRPSRSP